jgi:anaerobic selenocysteine-containing dehydrogenase
MAKLTRRGLLKQTAVGVVTAGVAAGAVAVAPHLAAMADAPTTQTGATSPTVPATGPLVVHVHDPSTGEGSILLGEQEFTFHNPGLVSNLLNLAK